jgi:threonine dehydratase
MHHRSPSLHDIEAARSRLAPYLPITPLSLSAGLSEALDRTVHIKWDNKFRTGSFKERGALNFLLRLTDEQLQRGVCAASAGNHALALSFHAKRLGAPCHLVMPSAAPLVKVESCRKLGAHIQQFGTLYECLQIAQELAASKGFTFVPPFDHPYIVEGQGVAGVELVEQLGDFDSVVIPVGGGGYAAGVATVIKALRPHVFILGVCSEWAVKMRSSPPHDPSARAPMTIADGIAVKTIGCVTGPILNRYVDAVLPVSEEAIARAIMALLEHEHTVVEGAGAAALAGLMEGLLPNSYRKPAVFVCGSNIDMNLLSRLIEHDMAERGRLLRVCVTLPDQPGMLHHISGVIALEGANVLEVNHNRSYARIPGHVEITLLVEVRDTQHGECIIEKLRASNVPTDPV